MRTDKELINLLITNIDTHFMTGLCFMVYGLKKSFIIFFNECDRIIDILKCELPVKNYYGYCWHVGDKAPRIEFLKQLIEKL